MNTWIKFVWATHPKVRPAHPAARMIGGLRRRSRAVFLSLFWLACWAPGPSAQISRKGGPAPSLDALRLAFDANQSANGAIWPGNTSYRLCASDVIRLNFALTPEFNQTVRIQPDGRASLRAAGPVSLEGLTPEEGASAVGVAYSGILRAPLVTLTLEEFNSPSFVISGQVKNPGRYALHGYTSAAEAIAIAGGLLSAAKASQVLLFRKDGDDWGRVIRIDMKRILQGKATSEDAEIRDGDMLMVPRSRFRK